MQIQDEEVRVIAPRAGWRLLAWALVEVWAYRDLAVFLVWRDVKVRYRQTFLGIAWVAMQPVANLVVLAFLFGRVLGVPSEGLPYPVFAFAGLVPWLFFSSTLTRCSASLVASSHVLTKVYFPRVIVPISAVLSGLVDLAVSVPVLVMLALWNGVHPGFALLLIPVLVVWLAVVTLAPGLWLSALNVRYRDVAQALPVALQIGMYLTPVVYPQRLLPSWAQTAISFNPMTATVEGFRWVLSGGVVPPTVALVHASLVSFPVVGVTLVTGLLYFLKTDRTFADVV